MILRHKEYLNIEMTRIGGREKKLSANLVVQIVKHFMIRVKSIILHFDPTVIQTVIVVVSSKLEIASL